MIIAKSAMNYAYWWNAPAWNWCSATLIVDLSGIVSFLEWPGL